MRLVWLWILGFAMVWPVHSTAATVGDKPIDLMLSDLLPLLMPLTYLLARSRANVSHLNCAPSKIRGYGLAPALALIFIAYSTALAGIGLGLSGEMVRVFSAFKLVKPLGFVFLGLLLGSWTDPFEFIGISARAFAVVVALTMYCTVTGPDFPLGEWARYIFEFELSGYPNSPMSFYAALIPLLLAVADTSKQKMVRVGIWVLTGCSVLMILGTMSRSATLTLFVGFACYLILTGRTAHLVAGMVGLMVLSAIGFGLFAMLQETQFVSILTHRIQERVDRSTESEDPSSGRFELWQLAIELWTERPVFGYMFESFSRHADVDTPHQQYLEVLHKCGGLGILMYISFLTSCMTATSRLIHMTEWQSPKSYQLRAVQAMMAGLLVGNMTQPNFTFSLTGDFVFLLFGCLCTPRAAISASEPVRSRAVVSTSQNSRQQRRVAA